jgi:hypothetical protein
MFPARESGRSAHFAQAAIHRARRLCGRRVADRRSAVGLIQQPQVHIEPSGSFPIELQNEFHVHEMVSDASFDDFSRIRKVVGEIRVGGPLP